MKNYFNNNCFTAEFRNELLRNLKLNLLQPRKSLARFSGTTLQQSY